MRYAFPVSPVESCPRRIGIRSSLERLLSDRAFRGATIMPQKALQIDRVAYEQWCRKLTLAPATVSFLSTLRASSPVRRVASRAGNVSGEKRDCCWRKCEFATPL